MHVRRVIAYKLFYSTVSDVCSLAVRCTVVLLSDKFNLWYGKRFFVASISWKT